MNTFLLAVIIFLISVIGYFLRNKFNSFDKTFRVVKYNIKSIANALAKNKRIDFDQSLLEDYSPTKLTENGKDYLEEIGFIKIFSDNSKRFFHVIDLDNPTTKYDVEVSAFKSVLALLDESYFKPVKIHFYNNPKEDIRGFAKVSGVYVRDQYLNKHSEISQ